MTAEELAKILDDLGQRLGPAGEHVFGLAVRQVFIDAAINLLAGGLLTVIASVMWIRGKRWVVNRSADQQGYHSDDFLDVAFPIGFLAMGVALVGCFGIAGLWFGLSTILNPEYAAIRDMLEALP